eukprot:TRINITY_DN92927_c0_g1_i1.p1 TRINITY_DN92927_c0_g1~~TRINITY_DN92927_c0_g1_i1.p1  ORF type:complete len:118 (-),score=30.43 TRINITY_DN92927_c0_g1_i1:25-378(-)
MASFLFMNYLNAMKPAYETRVDTTWEGPKLKQVWMEIEQRCFETYLDEANDDDRRVHPYQKLKKEVSQCKVLIKEDTRRDVLADCTERIVEFARECQSNRKKESHQPPGSARSTSRD